MTRKRGLSFEKWPLSDRRSFLVATRSGSRRSDQWHAARLAKDTVAGHVCNYGLCLKWLSEKSEGWESCPAAERWPRQVLNAMIDEIAPGYATASVVSRVRSLKKMLSLISPGTDLAHFDVAIRQLGRVGPAIDPLVHRVSSEDLYRCGLQLMSDAEGSTHLASELRALMFQTGFQIALLSRRPWRSRAFCAVRIGQQLVLTHSGWRLVGDANASARKRSASSAVPGALIEPLERLIHYWRPVLQPNELEPLLWARPGGMPFDRGCLHYYISRATKEYFKFPISPKWFRKVLSTTVARDHPEIVHVSAIVLGHDHRIDERFYNLAGSVEAYCDLADCIDAIARTRDGRKTQGR